MKVRGQGESASYCLADPDGLLRRMRCHQLRPPCGWGSSALRSTSWVTCARDASTNASRCGRLASSQITPCSTCVERRMPSGLRSSTSSVGRCSSGNMPGAGEHGGHAA